MIRRGSPLVEVGRSVERCRIDALILAGSTTRTVLVLGGMHGDEPKGVHVAQQFARAIMELGASERVCRCVVLPVVNPDGYARRKRRNAHGVDINRNFPTANWALGNPRSRMYGGPNPASEPETRAVMKAVERFQPVRIITIHSIGLNRFCNNYDGPGKKLVQMMARHNGYPVTSTIGYPTPGSFGTWAGRELSIPTVTLELPSHKSAKRCWLDNREALLAAAH